MKFLEPSRFYTQLVYGAAKHFRPRMLRDKLDASPCSAVSHCFLLCSDTQMGAFLVRVPR